LVIDYLIKFVTVTGSLVALFNSQACLLAHLMTTIEY
jgi:hypothetical protein